MALLAFLTLCFFALLFSLYAILSTHSRRKHVEEYHRLLNERYRREFQKYGS